MVTEEIYQLNSMLIEGMLPEKQEGVESERDKIRANEQKDIVPYLNISWEFYDTNCALERDSARLVYQ